MKLICFVLLDLYEIKCSNSLFTNTLLTINSGAVIGVMMREFFMITYSGELKRALSETHTVAA